MRSGPCFDKHGNPPGARARYAPLLALVLAVLVGGWGSRASLASITPPADRSASASTIARTSIVGRWQTTRTCQGLVAALGYATAAAWLAAKTHLCAGAQPQLHSHFFTRDGSFGSLDQNGSQVDNGVYRVINNHVLSIGSQGLVS